MKRMTTQHSIAWLLLTILPLLITGCWDQRPIENLAIIIALGADTNQQNPNLADYTFGYPLYAELKRSAAKIVTTGAPTLGKALEIWQASSDLEYAGGKIRLVLVGEEMAKQGLPSFFNYVQLTKTDDNAAVAVAKGRAEDLLRANVTETERTGTFITSLITTAHANGFGFRSEVSDVMTAYVAPGIDPIMPLLELSDGKDVIQIVGSALFNDLLLSGELNQEETLLLAALLGRAPSVTMSLTLGANAELESPPPEIRLIHPATKFVPTVENGQLQVKVKFESSYVVRNSFSVTDMTEQGPAAQLSSAMESNLTIAIQRLLAKLQAARSDPIGIGKKLRVKNNQSYDDNQFRDMWEKASLDVQVDLKYLRDGTLLQTQPKSLKGAGR